MEVIISALDTEWLRVDFPSDLFIIRVCKKIPHAQWKSHISAWIIPDTLVALTYFLTCLASRQYIDAPKLPPGIDYHRILPLKCNLKLPLGQKNNASLKSPARISTPKQSAAVDTLTATFKNAMEARHYSSRTKTAYSTWLERLPASDLYESNKTILKMLSDGFILKREDRSQKDLYIQLIDYSGLDTQIQPSPEQLISIVGENNNKYKTDNNIYKFVNQLEIVGSEKRIPDGIIYINGIPLVVFEFKSAIREEATIHDAYTQLTRRYRRDIPELFKYNAFCVISDGVNNKAGSFFAPYEFYYGWRRITGIAKEADGIDSMFTLVQGMLQTKRLRDIIQNFIYFPDSSKKDEKIVCRYPQYYAAKALFENIKKAQKPDGNGKGGTYFGATGSGKSFTMLYLTRLLMKSEFFQSPTIVLITDRTDLDDQLAAQFVHAKEFIGDNNVQSVESRAHLRNLLRDRQSGGVFLTTIHKFTEDTELLTDRSNVICISDEAHRTQVNLDQKIKLSEKGISKTYGFAKYLHDSLPNACYVGFTGTPIDATLDVFGPVVDAYTMNESVKDEITVRIVYEGRSAKVGLKNDELEKIERYYEEAAAAGANEYQIEQSKKETANMYAILGDPSHLKALAEDFVNHYEKRLQEGASVKGGKND